MGELVYVIGFQRSGNHWLCRTLSDLFSVPIDSGKGDTRFASHIDPSRDFKIKIVHWSHQRYAIRGHGRRFVHTQRDPRDMVTSLKFYGGHKTMIQAIDWLDEHNYGGFMQSWLDNVPELWVTYEQMHSDRSAWNLLDRIYSIVMGENCHPQHIADCIERQKFKNWTHTNRRTNRKGIIGDWKNHFRRHEAKMFEEKYGWVMQLLGYEDNRDWWKQVHERRQTTDLGSRSTEGR